VTVHLIPCGISILDGIRTGNGRPAAAADLARARSGLLRWAADAVTCPPDSLVAEWSAALDQHARSLHLGAWGPEVGAETLTLAKRTAAGSELNGLLDRGDAVVLLASETKEGLLAALLVATRIAGGATELISYAQTPELPAWSGERGRYPIRRGRVAVVRVSGLDPDVADGFRAAAGGIGDVMRAALMASAGDAIDIHLTGGFKATLLHTLALAEILRSKAAVQDASQKVTACYLFERAESIGDGKVTEIGLRSFPRGQLVLMHEELKTVNRGEIPQQARLRDVAWSVEGRRPRLNPFGRGYLAILDDETGNTTEGERGRR
jgi:hypothetical protein